MMRAVRAAVWVIAAVVGVAVRADAPILIPGHYVDGYGGTAFTPSQIAEVRAEPDEDHFWHWYIGVHDAAYVYQGGYEFTWGYTSDVPVAVARDYDGDGFDDFAVYRPSTGVWWIIKSNCGVWGRWSCYATMRVDGTVEP